MWWNTVCRIWYITSKLNDSTGVGCSFLHLISPVDSNPVLLWLCFHLLFSEYVHSIPRLLLLSVAIILCTCSVCCYSIRPHSLSSQDITLMPRMHHKHLFTNTWILFISRAVIRQVLDPYNNLLTWYLKRRYSALFSMIRKLYTTLVLTAWNCVLLCLCMPWYFCY